MSDPFQILSQSIRLFASNFIYFLKFWLVQLGISFLAAIAVIIPFVAGGVLASSGNLQPWMIILGIVAVLGVLVVFIWLAGAMYVQLKSVIDKSVLPIGDILKGGWQIAGKVFFTSLLVGLLVFVGIILLVIPGLIFAIWFSLAIPAFIFEGTWGWSALSRSRQLVKGRYWKAVWYVIFPTLAMMVIQLAVGLVTAGASLISSFFGQSINLAFSILSIPLGTIIGLYMLLVYQQFANNSQPAPAIKA